MEQEQQVINEFKKEFEGQLAKGQTEPFAPSAKTSAAIGQLTRGLETKRQTSALTTQENLWLKAIDEMFEKMANYNRKVKEAQFGSPPQAQRSQVYNLGEQKLSEEQESSSPFFVPKISDEEAEKIIATLNKQFEEKVLKEIKSRQPVSLPEDLGMSQPDYLTNAVPDVPSGRSLEDYLATVRADRPELPFADSDSQTDLSELLTHT